MRIVQRLSVEASPKLRLVDMDVRYKDSSEVSLKLRLVNMDVRYKDKAEAECRGQP